MGNYRIWSKSSPVKHTARAAPRDYDLGWRLGRAVGRKVDWTIRLRVATPTAKKEKGKVHHHRKLSSTRTTLPEPTLR